MLTRRRGSSLALLSLAALLAAGCAKKEMDAKQGAAAPAPMLAKSSPSRKMVAGGEKADEAPGKGGKGGKKEAKTWKRLTADDR